MNLEKLPSVISLEEKETYFGVNTFIIYVYCSYYFKKENTDSVTERVCVGPVACFSRADKQARLLERKVCFISDASNWDGGWCQTSVQRLTPTPTPTCSQWGKSFHR